MLTPYYDDGQGIVLYNARCEDILPHLDRVDLVLTDPPYNIGKADWDRVSGYVAWLVEVLSLAAERLKNNGSLWFFHMVFTDLASIDVELRQKTGLRHKQLIILDKGLQSIAGRTSENLRSFPRATEYLQFYTYPDPTGAQQLGEKYAAINPMAQYLRDEFRRAGIVNGEVAKLFPSKSGGMTGCVSNWLLGLNFPTIEQYDKMRGRLGDGYLRREYEDLRREYEDLRYTFNLPQGLTDVWYANTYQQEKNGHETQKPLLILKRVIQAATDEDNTILDPFAGSCTTGVAAKILKRKCILIEQSERYCEIGAKRLNSSVPLFDRPIQEGLGL